MFNFDRTDLQRIAAAAIGALFVSTACIAVTVAPVSATDQANVAQIAATDADRAGA